MRVKLFAAGVNPADTYIRTGNYGFFKPTLPYTPGTDGAGVVEAVGEGVFRLKPGDRVFVAALLGKANTGAYAAAVVCDESVVHPLPETLSFEQGAALGVPAAAAYRALFHRGRLRPGETVLIRGASGGVGSLAVQMARNAGAFVAGSASTEEGREMVRGLGAQTVLDHSDPDAFDRAARELAPDLIVEMLANENLARDLALVAKFGRVVVVGNRGSLDFNPRDAMAKEADVLGMAVWNAPPREYRESLCAIAAALAAGSLRPFVDRSFPLAEAARALHQTL